MSRNLTSVCSNCSALHPHSSISTEPSSFRIRCDVAEHQEFGCYKMVLFLMVKSLIKCMGVRSILFSSVFRVGRNMQVVRPAACSIAKSAASLEIKRDNKVVLRHHFSPNTKHCFFLASCACQLDYAVKYTMCRLVIVALLVLGASVVHVDCRSWVKGPLHPVYTSMYLFLEDIDPQIYYQVRRTPSARAAILPPSRPLTPATDGHFV